jgi:hypothetical protein
VVVVVAAAAAVVEVVGWPGGQSLRQSSWDSTFCPVKAP